MKLKQYFLIILSFITISLSAQNYKLEGKIGSKYSIVVELHDLGDGLFSGRYAYNTTLKRDGNVDCSWLKISPSKDSPMTEWVVTDCKGNQVEVWYNIRFIGQTHLSARMINVKGRSYDVEADVKGSSNQSEALDSYFKQHIGQYVSEFDMFNDQRVKSRLQKMMGASNFELLKKIYEVEVPIEYHNGMFWAKGFMAHQCCDPITVWAYDTYTNSFYVWILKDDKEYWWSESERDPFKFRTFINSYI